MIDLSVAVTVFAEFHGHFPGDAIAAAGGDVFAVVFLGGVFGVVFVGFEESFFEVLKAGLEREGFEDLSFLAIGVGGHDHDLCSAFAFAECTGPGFLVAFKIVVEAANDIGMFRERLEMLAGGSEFLFVSGDENEKTLVSGRDIEAEFEGGEVGNGCSFVFAAVFF